VEIKAVLLVKNEERFLEQIINTSLCLADEVFVLDNNSTDNTAVIAKSLPGVTYVPTPDLSKSHDIVKQWVGKDVWLFGPDGDEIYHPQMLTALRKRILLGHYQHWWMLRGAMLHTTDLNERGGKVWATGYMAPPAHNVVNLYNLSCLKRWRDLPGEHRPLFFPRDKVFKPGYSDSQRYRFYDEEDWSSDPLRCLHVRFLPRSKVDNKTTTGNRLNPWDVVHSKELVNTREIYRVGGKVTQDVTEFFPNGVPKL
jgi:glycosyltransferase involved in cell wall biosynthesis